MTISVHDSFDFKDGADASVEYLYDANGNMIQDKNKGIAEIRYNHLNMPTRITYDNGNMIDYLYSAAGAKLKVTHTTNKLLMVNSNLGNSAAARTLLDESALLTVDEPVLAGRTRVRATAASDLDIQTTDYVNGYILENGALSQIQLNGGYMTEDSQGKAVYHFYLQDHQGNNRVVVNGKTLAVEQVNHYYPYGGLFAESTGGEMQAFKYNGKELDRMCGLNWYDHGARHNDAAIGRWHCIDPLAEKYYSISPYAYCAGDPVNFGDYNGMSYGVDTTGVITYVPDGINELTGQTPSGEMTWTLSNRQEKALNKIYAEQKSDENQTTISRTKLTREEATSLFKMLASSSYTEWAITETKNVKGVAGNYIFQANHVVRSEDDNIMGSVNVPFDNLLSVNFHIHSHGDVTGTIGPSGSMTNGDRGMATKLYEKSGYISHANNPQGEYVLPPNEDYKLMVYHRYSNTLVKYNPSSPEVVVKSGFSQFK